jgi:outer membrane protein assembly factor BamB
MKLVNSAMVITLGAAALLQLNSIKAQDWPQWRGPHRDGKTTGFTAPESWPQKLTQKWKITVGVGDSTPALVGDKLYAFGRQGDNEVITALNGADGKTLWQESYPADYIVTGPPARHPGTRSSPVVAAGKICTLGVGGILSCLDAATGKVLWRKQSTNDYLGTAYQSDSSMSPLVVDGLCVVQVGGKPGGAAIAFDLATGEPKWKWSGDAPASSSPALLTVAGTRQIVTFTVKNLVGLDLADGRLLWQIPFEARQGNNTTPVIDGDTVIYTGQNKGTSAVKIEKQGDTFAATPLWTNPELGSRFTTPVLKDGLLFGFTARLYCANARTGATLWMDDASRGMSVALVDAGPVLFALSTSELAVFKPSDKGYSELAKYKVADSETWAHPVSEGNRIFVRDHESVALWTIE